MKKIILLFFLLPALFAAQKNPFASDPQAAEAGRGIFRVYCSACHGVKAQGGRAPDLTLGIYAAGNQDADLYKVITDGVAGTEMPDFGERLGEDNIWRLVSYIRTVAERSTPGPVGDQATGEKLFWGKGQCGLCHRIGDRGSRMGPDLTRVGRQRSLAYLRESVISPNADLTPGYATITVVMRDGKEIIGAQKAIDNFSVQLMDSGENFYSFFRTEVKSVKREFRSLMPEDYGRRLSPPELNDLLAYLSSLRGEEKKR